MWASSVALVFAFSGAVALATVVVAWGRRRSTLAAWPLLLCAGGAVVWATAAMANVVLAQPRTTLAVTTLGLVGQCGTAFGYSVLAIVVRDSTWRPRRRTLLLALEPAVVLALAFTNPWHHLLYPQIVEWRPGVWVATFGLLFWIHVAYSSGVFAIASAGMLVAAKRPHGDVRGGRWGFAILIPGFVSELLALFVFDQYLDLALVGIAGSAALACWAFSRESFDQLLPEARKKVLDTISDGVAVIDPERRIIHLNPAAQGLAAWLSAPGATNGALITDMLPGLPLDPDADSSFAYRSGTDDEFDIRISVIRDEAGRCAGWTLVARDVTVISRQNRELEQANLRLQSQLEMIESLRDNLAEQAARDPLTGLYNRRHLMLALDDLLRGTQAVSVALIDVDRFKSVNDTYGHGVGDDVLLAVALLLGQDVVSPELLARYGGEEFVLVLPGLQVEEAAARLESLRARLASEPISTAGQAIPVTFSAGVATACGPTASFDLLDDADRALYRAKRTGRNRIEVAVAPAPARG